MFTRLQKITLHKLRLQEFKPYLAVDMKLTMTVFHNYTHGRSCMVELIPFHNLQLISIGTADTWWFTCGLHQLPSHWRKHFNLQKPENLDAWIITNPQSGFQLCYSFQLLVPLFAPFYTVKRNFSRARVLVHKELHLHLIAYKLVTKLGYCMTGCQPI